MKKLLLALLFVPAFASAQSYTPLYGCFRENGSIYCSNAKIQCDMTANYLDNNLYYFGFTAGSLCNAYVYSLSKYNAALTGMRRNNNLVSRLRKMCGSRCRNVK